jgi:hypothetical protein
VAILKSHPIELRLVDMRRLGLGSIDCGVCCDVTLTVTCPKLAKKVNEEGSRKKDEYLSDL